MNTWEIRTTQSGSGFYQDRIAFEGTFDEAIEFAKSGYEILGGIEYQDRKYEGEYRMISSKEEVIVQVH